MRKSLIVFAFMFALAGCGMFSTPAPTPTPPPTATPTQAPRYYPTPEEKIKISLIQQLPKETFPKRYYEVPEGNYYVAMTISTGETGQMVVGDWTLDILWVYERNASVVLYPIVVGVWDGKTYTPYLYHGYPGYNEIPKERDVYLDYLQKHEIFDKGRLIFPRVQGDFVSRTGIDWQQCGENTFCRLGQYIEDKYHLDRLVEMGIVGVNTPIPEGWVLAWYWIPSTEVNTLPGFEKVELP